MKISKAIEIKLQWRKDGYPTPLADEMNADMMSIEALKRCKERSDRFPNLPHLRLPGETPETATTRSLHHIKAVLESPEVRK